MRAFRGVLLLLVPVLLLGAAAPARPADRRVSEIHALGLADQEQAYTLILNVLSKEGRAILDEGHHSIIVHDFPEQQEAVRKTLATLQQPLPSVRVEASIIDGETKEVAEISAGGQILLSLPPPQGGGTVFFDVKESRTAKGRSSSQSVLVVSGGRAVISMGRKIPYLGWLYDFAEGQGLIARKVQWKEVASRLAVSPIVVDGGRAVRLRVVPELTYLVGKKSREIAFAGVSTEVTVPAGEDVLIGAGGENEDFDRHFFAGYDRQRRVRRVEIRLKATVVP